MLSLVDSLGVIFLRVASFFVIGVVAFLIGVYAGRVSR